MTARIVLSAVLLVVVVAAAIAAATALGVRGYLLDRLEGEVQRSAQRAPADLTLYEQGVVPGLAGSPGDRGGPDDGPGGPRIQDLGSLTAFIGVTGQEDFGWILTEGQAGQGGAELLGTGTVVRLSEVPADGRAHRVEVEDGDSYLVVVTSLPGGTVISGLPTDDVDDVVSTIVTWEVALVAIGAVVALGVGLVVVRRQLRPLRKVAATAHAVAALPLDTGDVEDLQDRVPAHLRDGTTEVGQVGAALHTLLSHVESSLRARHRSEQQVRQFVADASHELRTPLATVVGYTELARRRPDDVETVRTALARVADESTRMTSLVEDLLLLARLDAGRPLATGVVDLTRLLLEVTRDAQVLAPSHRWRLELPDEAVEVHGDEERLRQVLSNLVTNARKHTPPGTTVTVGAHADHEHDRTVVTVQDDGPGVSPELTAHAFERFARGDSSRNREGGAGLGLSIVQAIVSAHGGSVSLCSEPGRTVVSIDLPAG
ncbi:sensor histidine kinase [Nocardioides abyssi]|uniref:histidine kinase n=1 Tax=Nocardioides abyssi TaxID=3058370 RepID=A0ABT8EXW5_9ACTN|nr:ATP-binding protein [Nocardioides abyssi]MDN4162977.1 ATP-binding protein [Nocardioides abyssi]